MRCQACGAPGSVSDHSGQTICDPCDSQAISDVLADSVDRLVLTGAASGFPCPVCGDAALEKGSIDQSGLIGCRRCQGALMPRAGFAKLVTHRRAAFNGQEFAPEPNLAIDGPRDIHHRLGCPICREPMDSFFYAGPGRVAIDSCHGCDAVWLDCGEISRIEQAPGRRPPRTYVSRR